MLLTSVNGILKAYFYEECYIRTASQEYHLEQVYTNKLIHLTNDAIQQKSNLYGKYEPANKLSCIDL